MISYIDNHFTHTPSLSAFDLAILRSIGAFDFMRSYGGEFFHLDKHLERFKASCKTLNLPLSHTKEEIEAISYELLQRNGLSDGALKWIVTSGESSHTLLPEQKSHFIATIAHIPQHPEAHYNRGIFLKSCHYQRFLPTVKSTNYLPAAYTLQNNPSFHEALYLSEDEVITECATANFFAIIDHRLITPKEKILEGITKEVVLELASSFIEVEEKKIFLKDLEHASEYPLNATSAVSAAEFSVLAWR